MQDSEQLARNLAEETCALENIILAGFQVQGKGNNRLIKVTVDTEKGITLDECHKLSREINDLFFRKNIYSGEYRLEVSSPGVDKALQHDYEFIRNIGRQLIVIYENEDQTHTRSGILKSYENRQLSLEEKGELLQIPVDTIKSAKVKLQW